MSSRRGRAEEIAHDVAARLTDPEAVAAVCSAPTNHPTRPGSWQPASLAEGSAGAALLFTELAVATPSLRHATHAHLAAAATGIDGTGPHGLYSGIPAVAFAADCAHRASGDYGRLLRTLDERVLALADAAVARENARIDGKRTNEEMHSYDLISGLTGLARLLLDRAPEAPAVDGVLACLIRLTEPVTLRGERVPGWWVDGAPLVGAGRGHLNLGLAHGAAGLLPVLAFARRRELPGAAAAIERVRSWLLRWRTSDPVDGVRWPPYVSFAHETGRCARPPGGMNAWCYGTPGITYCLLAGNADDRDAIASAESAMLSLTGTVEYRDMADPSLCHGLAGLLTVTQTLVDHGCTGLARHLDTLAGAVIDRYDPATPFGFVYPATPGAAPTLQRGGFLDGAAGTALALFRYATRTTATSWPRSMLLA